VAETEHGPGEDERRQGLARVESDAEQTLVLPPWACSGARPNPRAKPAEDSHTSPTLWTQTARTANAGATTAGTSAVCAIRGQLTRKRSPASRKARPPCRGVSTFAPSLLCSRTPLLIAYTAATVQRGASVWVASEIGRSSATVWYCSPRAL
jgi:hypothetical protein